MEVALEHEAADAPRMIMEHPEVYLDGGKYVDRLALSLPRLEASRFDSLNGFLVESDADCPPQLNVPRKAIISTMRESTTIAFICRRRASSV